MWKQFSSFQAYLFRYNYLLVNPISNFIMFAYTHCKLSALLCIFFLQMKMIQDKLILRTTTV